MASRIHINKAEHEQVVDVSYDVDFEVSEDTNLEDVLSQILVATLQGKQNVVLEAGKYGIRLLGIVVKKDEAK